MFVILCISIPCIIIIMDEILMKMLKQRMAIVFAVVVLFIYLLVIIYTLYIVRSIVGILEASNGNEIVKFLGIFMVACSILDFVLRWIHIISPICKMQSYNKAAKKVSGLERNCDDV